jgi:hypothetical protein
LLIFPPAILGLIAEFVWGAQHPGIGWMAVGASLALTVTIKQHIERK